MFQSIAFFSSFLPRGSAHHIHFPRVLHGLYMAYEMALACSLVGLQLIDEWLLPNFIDTVSSLCASVSGTAHKTFIVLAF